MKKGYLLLAGGVGFCLVWAAGHDILSKEPDTRLEYAVVIIGLVLALAALAGLLRQDHPRGQA